MTQLYHMLILEPRNLERASWVGSLKTICGEGNEVRRSYKNIQHIRFKPYALIYK
jgi:hypothetical protein